MGLYPHLTQISAGRFDHLSQEKNQSSVTERSLDWELSREDVHILAHNQVAFGDNVFGGFDIALLAEFISPFNDFLQAIADSHPEIPFRCSFKFDGLKPKTMKVKEQYVTFFGFTNPIRHRNIRSAFEHLQEDEATPEDLIRLRIGFATWSNWGDEKQLRQNLSLLRSSVEQWGNFSTDRITGDPVATILSTVPGFGPTSTAPEVLAPLGEALSLFPLARKASPWSRGEVLFRTPDGVGWPYQRGSTRQNSWLEILIGSSGTGKSVALNALNLGNVLAGSSLELQGEELPKMVIVDVGHSSRGLIRILQEALPTGRKNEAVHLVFKLLPEKAINPFDLPLGFRQPMHNHRHFLLNFIAILVNDASLNTPIDLEGILGVLIDQTYEHYADRGSPKRYYPGEEERLDALLQETGFTSSDYSSWWEVTDWLFSQGHASEANLAQTKAVPVLTDLVQILHSPNFASFIRPEDGRDESAIGELIAHLQIKFSEAVRDLPIIANPTRFDLGAARVMAIDVSEVLDQANGLDSQKTSSLMFMLARHVAMRTWEVDEEEVLAMTENEDLPEIYQGLHIQHAKSERGQPKVLCIDEYHRASSVKEINTQLIRDAREGRKRNFRITLASQLVNDFDPEILNLASTVLIFGNQLPNEVRGLQNFYPLTTAAEDILVHELTGPTAEGAPLLGIFRTKEGTVVQKLLLKLSPDELWEFSTTTEDVLLRQQVYETFGVTDGRKKLSNRFPTGTAREKIQNMKFMLTADNRKESHGDTSVIATIVKELHAFK